MLEIGSSSSTCSLSKLACDGEGAGKSKRGDRFRLARLLLLYIASSAASNITLSRSRAASITCSSLVNSFFLILSGRVKNQLASLLETDCCRPSFLSRRDEDADLLGSMRETFTPRRSARELLRWLCMGRSWRAFDLEFCANLKRSSVEKYCKTPNQPGSTRSWVTMRWRKVQSGARNKRRQEWCPMPRRVHLWLECMTSAFTFCKRRSLPITYCTGKSGMGDSSGVQLHRRIARKQSPRGKVVRWAEPSRSRASEASQPSYTACQRTLNLELKGELLKSLLVPGRRVVRTGSRKDLAAVNVEATTTCPGERAYHQGISRLVVGY